MPAPGLPAKKGTHSDELGVPLLDSLYDFLVSERCYQWLAAGLYCCVQFLNGSSVNIVGPAGPTLASSLNTRVEDVGNILSAEGAGNLTAALLISSVLQRFNGHSVIRALSLVMFVCLGLVPSCSSISQVTLLYFGVGSCLGLLSSVANTLMTWVQAGRNVGPWVNLINACFGLGSSSAPIVFVAVERRIGNGLASFSAIGCFAAATALAASLLRSPASPPPPKAVVDTSARSLGHARGGSTIAGIDLGSREAYVRCTVMAPLMMVMTFGIGGEIAYGAWVFAYATKRAGMPSGEAAGVNSFYWSAFTLGRMGLIPLATVFTPEVLLLSTMAVEVGVSILVLLSSGSSTVLWTATAMLAFGVCAIYSNVVSLLSAYDLLTPGSVSVLQVASGMGHMTGAPHLDPSKTAPGPHPCHPRLTRACAGSALWRGCGDASHQPRLRCALLCACRHKLGLPDMPVRRGRALATKFHASIWQHPCCAARASTSPGSRGAAASTEGPHSL